MEQKQDNLRITRESWQNLVAQYTIPEAQASTWVLEGEEVAVLTPMEAQVIASTELFLEGIHFDLSYTPWQYLGEKLITLALSKIYAKNGTPTQVQFAFALTDRVSLLDMQAFWQGAQLAARRYAVDLVDGGRATVASGAMIISAQVLGSVNAETWVGIDGFSEGQVLCVTAELGAPYLGLLLLEREKQIQREHPELKPNFENQHTLLHNFFHPISPQSTLEQLRTLGIRPLAMTHLLDGLASALFRIAKRNKLGVLVYEDKLPIAEYARQFACSLPIDPTLCALNGGEETALLLALDSSTYLKIAEKQLLYPIGVVQDADKGLKLQSQAGNIYDLKAQGWS